MLYNDFMDKEALSEFASFSSSYSRQMTEAWLNMVKSGQYQRLEKAEKVADNGNDYVAEYREALKNWLALKIPS